MPDARAPIDDRHHVLGVRRVLPKADIPGGAKDAG
jgi:hypothetical protein